MGKADRRCFAWLACFLVATSLAACHHSSKTPPANHPPQVNAGLDQTITLPSTATLRGKATDDGLPTRTLKVKWSQQSGPGSIAFSDPSAIVTTATFSAAGTYVVRLTATDTMLTSSDDITVTVNPPVQVNHPPQANAGPDQTVTLPAPATLKGTVTDDGLPAGGTLSASWTKLSGPGTITFANPTASETTVTFSEAGTYVLRLSANDSALLGSDDITVTVNPSAPTNRAPQANAGPDQTVTLPAKTALKGKITDDGLPAGATLTSTWAKQSGPGTVTFGSASAVETTAEFSVAGTYVLRLTANDSALTGSDDITVTVNPIVPVNRAPQVSAGPDQTITLPAGATLKGMVTDDGLPAGSTLTSTWTKQSGPGNVTFSTASSANTTATFSAAGTYVLRLTANDSALSSNDDMTVTVSAPSTGLPPDPATVAPPIDPTVATTMDVATAFLYTGPNPIQTGVAPGTINPVRVAVIRGRVLDKANDALSGVTITILNHPEFGQTLSRADGRFDLAVNGGGLLTINYMKAGFLSGQRPVNAPWQDYVFAEDIVLIQQDTKVTTLNLADTTQAFQVAQGSPVTDQDGTRQATLLIPQGTQAQVYNPDGTTRSVTSLKLRLTEYTLGANGPSSMPAPLPPSSAYTYAFEMKADEAAIKRNGKDVLFDRPVPFYTSNFLNFPVGTVVPVGYYDQDKGLWVPSDSGKVIKILAINNGTVEIDSDGDGLADDTDKLTALGISEQERTRLAGLYTVGQTLWRVQVKHLSTWDLNWGFSPPPDAAAPTTPNPERDKGENDPDLQCGSVIECQNQILRESLPIAGSSLTLNYASDRVVGRKARKTVIIEVSGTQLPGPVKRIDLQIDIAGRFFEQSLAAQPNQRHTFVWDGGDIYGRAVVGTSLAKIGIGYTYDGAYQSTDRFGYNGNGTSITGSRTRQEAILWQRHILPLAATPQVPVTAGWSLSVHHVYDPNEKTLYLGNGERRNLNVGGSNDITTVAGNGTAGFGGDGGPASATKLNKPNSIALGPDASLYVADTNNHRIRRVGRDGIIRTVAGNGTPGYSGDGGPATAASLNFPNAVALGQDGDLYIADTKNHRVRRVGPDGIITTVAGNSSGTSCNVSFDPCGDGGLATAASLNNPSGIALGPDGGLYIADTHTHRVRHLGVDGVMTTVVGNGIGAWRGDGGPAAAASLNFPNAVALGPDGRLYIADTGNGRIRRLGPDGTISTIAGNGFTGSSGDGGPATAASLSAPTGIALGPDGGFYIANTQAHRVHRVGSDGIITIVAGNGISGFFSSDGGPAPAASLSVPTGIALGPDGSLYIADSDNHRVRRVSPMLPGYTAGDLVIPSADGTEIYRFNSGGRHLQTLNALTGAVLYEFNYSETGLLTSVKDANGNITTIERDGSGNATAIVTPFGRRTALTHDANGYLASVTNPAGEAYQMTYSADGLLTEFKNPKGNISVMSYDNLGRLDRDTDAAGGFKSLVRRNAERSYTVNLSTALGRTTSYFVEDLTTGNQRRLTTAPDGTKTEMFIGTDGSRKTTLVDGTIIDLLEGPDPRFSMQAPIPKSLAMSTAGLTSSLTTGRTVSQADPNNPLSLATLTDTVILNGRTFRSIYDAATKAITSTSAAGRISKVATDNLGRVVQSQVTGLSETKIAYDTHGRLATIAQGAAPNSREAKFSYNPQGYLDKLTDPLGRAVSFAYDPAGRVTKQTLPDGREIAYGYDANGNLTSLTPPGRPGHVFKYDKVDQTSAYEPPPVAGTGNTVYEYNLDKDLTKITRPDGQTLTFDYDTGGRLQTLILPGGKLDYGYDATSGKLTKVTAQDATLAYTYNGALLTKTASSGSVIGQVERVYDNDFRVTSLSVNGANPITFQYDADSLLTKAGDLTLTRSGQNGFLEGTGLVSVTDSYAYDGFGGVTAYEAKYNASSLLRFEYSYDKLGRITQKKEIRSGTTHTFDYGYDTAGRLTEVKRDGTVTASYGYDPNGNRTHLNGATIAHYDAQDRLLDYQGATYQYSANGELQQKTVGSQITKYSYDVLGNLKKVTLPNGTVIDYLIDGQNRRIGKKVGGTLTQAFLYQGQLQPIAELNGSGTVVSRFVYATGVNVPDYLIKGGVTYRIIKDHLGSPRLVVDVATNTVAQELEYDTFGNVTKDTNPGFQPFGFAGGIYDKDTKLVRFGARDYDAETGRWTAKDPVRLRGGSLNFFGYVENEPLNRRDLFGLKFRNIDSRLEAMLAKLKGSTSPEIESTINEIERSEQLVDIVVGKTMPSKRLGNREPLGDTGPRMCGNTKAIPIEIRIDLDRVPLDAILKRRNPDFLLAELLAHELRHAYQLLSPFWEGATYEQLEQDAGLFGMVATSWLGED